MTPFFSIVIPSYNRLNFLRIALKSISEQVFTDYEIIVINDGSSDGTETYLESEALSNNKLRAIHQQNTERGKARNNGWRAAKGEYVVFFDSDDIMLPNYLSTLKKHIEKLNPDLIACKFAFIEHERPIPHRDQIPLKGKYGFELFLSGNPIACHFAIRNDLEKFQLFNEDRSLASMEDWLFLIKNTVNHTLYIVDEICVHMQIHAEQSMGNDHVVINRKLTAENIILNSLNLSKSQKKRLKAHVLENVSIHQINNQQKAIAIKNLFRSILIDGLTSKRLYNIARAIKPS
jgi:glycosyltransferase involved in cell wall biosynthesis